MDRNKIYQVANEADACIVAGPELAIVAVSKAIMAQNAPKALKDLLAFDNAGTFPADQISSTPFHHDVETTLIVCAVLHNRHDIVPRVLKLAKLEKVVSLGKLWQCQLALQFRAEIWMSAIGAQTVEPNTLATLLKLSIDLDSETSLKEAYKHLVLDLPFNTDFSTLPTLTLGVRALMAEARSLRNSALADFMIAVCSVYKEFEARHEGTKCYKISKCRGTLYPVETDPIEHLKPYNLCPSNTLLLHSPASLIKITEKLTVIRPAMGFSYCECQACGRTYKWRCNAPFNIGSPFDLMDTALKAARRAIPKISIAELKHEAEAAALKLADTVKFKQEPMVVKLKHDAEKAEVHHEECMADVKHDTATTAPKHEANIPEAKTDAKHTTNSNVLKQEADTPKNKATADTSGEKHESETSGLKHEAEKLQSERDAAKTTSATHKAEISEIGSDAAKIIPVKREAETDFLDAAEKTMQNEMEMQRAGREMSEDEVSIVSATEAQSPVRSG